MHVFTKLGSILGTAPYLLRHSCTHPGHRQPPMLAGSSISCKVIPLQGAPGQPKKHLLRAAGLPGEFGLSLPWYHLSWPCPHMPTGWLQGSAMSPASRHGGTRKGTFLEMPCKDLELWSRVGMSGSQSEAEWLVPIPGGAEPQPDKAPGPGRGPA